MKRFAVAFATAMAVLVTSAPSQGQTAPGPEVEQPALDLSDGGDPSSPFVVLPPVVTSLKRLEAGVASTGRDSLGKAVAGIGQALDDYAEGAADVRGVIRTLSGAARDVEKVRPAGEPERRQLAAAGDALADVARSLAVKIVERAAAAGVESGPLNAARAALATGDAKRSEGNYSGAAQSYGEGVAIGSGGLHFDLDVFERNLRSAIAPRVSGYAYTIGVNGKLARDGAGGQARTEADDPATPHSPDTEQFLASVSKTITGVAMLRALQDAGVSVDSPIDPYLPQSWTRGVNVELLTFRSMLSHKSGFSVNQGSTYELLRARMAQSFPFLLAYDHENANFGLAVGYEYSNANFGLMRILIPRVVDGPFPLEGVTPDAVLAELHAEAFEQYVRTRIFHPIGIDGRCRSSAPSDTRYYNFPAGNQPGYANPDRLLSCGGFGWHLSSNELGSFMSNLRYTNTLMSAETRMAMDKGFLGWVNPVFSKSGNGDFGMYRNHGGDWLKGMGDAHTCIMKFPIKVEASVVINSKHALGMHQCRVLREAFDASWVA